MQLIDVYDFDRTIFKYDTYSEFFRYVCTRHHPWMWILLIFPLVGFLLMLLMPWDVRPGKMITFIPIRLMNAPKLMEDFWAEMIQRGWIAPWFRPRENDVPVVVCTASPRFMVEPLLQGAPAGRLPAGNRASSPHAALYRPQQPRQRKGPPHPLLFSRLPGAYRWKRFGQPRPRPAEDGAAAHPGTRL